MPTHHDDDAGHPAAWGPGWPSALLGGVGRGVAGALGPGCGGALAFSALRRSGGHVVLAAVLLGGLDVQLGLRLALFDLTGAFGLDLLVAETLRLRFWQRTGARCAGQG